MTVTSTSPSPADVLANAEAIAVAAAPLVSPQAAAGINLSLILLHTLQQAQNAGVDYTDDHVAALFNGYYAASAANKAASAAVKA